MERSRRVLHDATGDRAGGSCVDQSSVDALSTTTCELTNYSTHSPCCRGIRHSCGDLKTKFRIYFFHFSIIFLNKIRKMFADEIWDERWSNFYFRASEKIKVHGTAVVQYTVGCWM